MHSSSTNMFYNAIFNKPAVLYLTLISIGYEINNGDDIIINFTMCLESQ